MKVLAVIVPMVFGTILGAHYFGLLNVDEPYLGGIIVAAFWFSTPIVFALMAMASQRLLRRKDGVCEKQSDWWPW